jgi:uncharacterized coiled-coil DUF342 family protein
MPVNGEEIVKLVQEKIAEKNEIIREQQMQIQELSQRIAELEQSVVDAREQASNQEDLYRKIAAIVD